MTLYRCVGIFAAFGDSIELARKGKERVVSFSPWGVSREKNISEANLERIKLIQNSRGAR